MSKGTFTNLFFGLKIEDLMKMVSMMGGQISLFLQWCFVGRNTKYDVKYDVIASSLKLSPYNRCYLHNRC